MRQPAHNFPSVPYYNVVMASFPPFLVPSATAHRESCSDVREPKCPPPTIMPMISAFMISRLVYLAAELGIADLIAGGLNTAEALADKTGTFAPALYRMLRALCAYGVLEEPVPGQFSLGLMGEQLQSDVPGSVRNFARLFADQRTWKCLTELEHTIRTGETGMRRAFGRRAALRAPRRSRSRRERRRGAAPAPDAGRGGSATAPPGADRHLVCPETS